VIREIVKYGSKVLRESAAPVKAVGDEIKQLIDDLFDSMAEADGVGLAAPQIGISRRVIAVDVSAQLADTPPIALINPRVLQSEGEDFEEEGCLSIPELYGEVQRPTRLEIDALDATGKPFQFVAETFYARVLQHEIDHLNGILFIDHISPLKRQLMRGALKRLRKEGELWDQEQREGARQLG
jgi:peptide deformylase